MGVEKQILAEGSGATPTRGASVTVHCTGYGKDSDLTKKFWRCGLVLSTTVKYARRSSTQLSAAPSPPHPLVRVHIHSTQDPGQEPFTFQVGLGHVIRGWDDGVLGMRLGEKARLTCSPDFAYGTRGFAAWGYPFTFVAIRVVLFASVCAYNKPSGVEHCGVLNLSASRSMSSRLLSARFSPTRRSFSRSRCSRSSSASRDRLSQQLTRRAPTSGSD